MSKSAIAAAVLLTASVSLNVYQSYQSHVEGMKFIDQIWKTVDLRIDVLNIKDVLDAHPKGAPVTKQLRQAVDLAYWHNVGRNATDTKEIRLVDPAVLAMRGDRE